MHLAGLWQAAQGGGYVEHGRELEHEEADVGQERGQELADIGGAVLDANGLAPGGVAAGRVEHHQIDVCKLCGNGLGIGTLCFGMVQPEQRQVVCHNGA